MQGVKSAYLDSNFINGNQVRNRIQRTGAFLGFPLEKLGLQCLKKTFKEIVQENFTPAKKSQN